MEQGRFKPGELPASLEAAGASMMGELAEREGLHKASLLSNLVCLTHQNASPDAKGLSRHLSNSHVDDEEARARGAQRASGSVRFPEANDDKTRTTIAKKQAAWLINRMRVAPELALVIAELAFTPIEAR